MFTDHRPALDAAVSEPADAEVARASFTDGWVVQLTDGRPDWPDAHVRTLHRATITLTTARISAMVDDVAWSWYFGDIEDVFHGADAGWTILAVPGAEDHGVAVSRDDARRFRRQLDDLLLPTTRIHRQPAQAAAVEDPPVGVSGWSGVPDSPPGSDDATAALPVIDEGTVLHEGRPPLRERRRLRAAPTRAERRLRSSAATASPSALAGIEARRVSAWFGTHLVLDRVSLDMGAGQVTALIGPSGCGKSTFLRILNRMHEMIPSAALAGEVLLDGLDVYEPARKVTDARRQIGMVFQKPNPFPAMSIYDNVLASFQLTGTKIGSDAKDEIVESCLRKGGLWNEVRDRLRHPGGSLSGGQQQRLCIARALAIRPRVLLMDEPCSALDPTSTRRIEETISELRSEVTIVIVTHNMQQAARVSDRCAFFLAEQNTPGVIVEHGPTDAMFHSPQDQRTSDYVNGRFG